MTCNFSPLWPSALRRAYDEDVARELARRSPGEVLGERDLAHLPPPVQRYLRAAGVVGRPRVYNFRARMNGRIRSSRDARWIPFTAEQYNFVEAPARLFYLTGSMFGIPVQGYHRYVGGSARMTIKAARLVRIADVSGPEMNQSETVTMFNDMCLMAPATLIGPAIAWQPVDALRARATFSTAGQSIRAELVFNDAGELIDFMSDDRYQASPDGRRMTRIRWSTPLGPYGSFNGTRIAAGGEARWHEAGGDYAYVQIALERVDYNVGADAVVEIAAA